MPREEKKKKRLLRPRSVCVRSIAPPRGSIEACVLQSFSFCCISLFLLKSSFFFVDVDEGITAILLLDISAFLNRNIKPRCTRIRARTARAFPKGRHNGEDENRVNTKRVCGILSAAASFLLLF
jgi:hypothetical protein